MKNKKDSMCIHDMPLMWCAECNGDVKKSEEDAKTAFSGLQSLAVERKESNGRF